MDTIKIRRDKDCYTAIMVDGKRKSKVAELFGTNELPTGFTEKACYLDVIKEIRRLNPDCRVIIA